MRAVLGITCIAFVLGLLAPVAKASSVEIEIERLAGTFSNDRTNTVKNSDLDAAVLLPEMYAQRGFIPAWFGTPNAEQLFRELNRGIAQGLRPKDLHLPQLYDLQEAAAAGGPADIAEFDIVASDAAITLIHHIFFGKVDPAALDSDWNFRKPVIDENPATVLNRYLDGDGFSALMELIDIASPQYEVLITALERYRGIARSGGWPMVPTETILKPGIDDPAILLLRERLARESVSSEPPGDLQSTVYDATLATAVESFQSRHGLEADGVIGPKTFRSLNKTAEQRVDQLRLSLERARWIMRELDDEFVLVNIAAPGTYLFKADNTLWTTRSITGSAYRKTPVFRDEIEYLEFNPTWTVPASIFRKDKLPRIRRDPGYLERGNYDVVRTSDRQPIAPSAVNWSASNPGVTLVQRPGEQNALGLVKFMFPNKYAVYLHDTNDRSLFDRNERNLSSGCVRIEKPFEFASLLLESNPDWTLARMQEVIASGKTTRVDLDEPMPVLLTYWTAWVEDSDVHFREDPYDRDGPILKALNR